MISLLETIMISPNSSIWKLKPILWILEKVSCKSTKANTEKRTNKSRFILRHIFSRKRRNLLDKPLYLRKTKKHKVCLKMLLSYILFNLNLIKLDRSGRNKKLGARIDIAFFALFLCATAIFIIVLNSQMLSQYPQRATIFWNLRPTCKYKLCHIMLLIA